MNALPPAEKAQVWFDFDGTITRRDLLDELIVNCSINDSWRQIERLWQAGEIGSRKCLEGQIALLRISDEDLAVFLKQVEIDPGLPPLLALLNRFEIPRAILSDGIDIFIHHILTRHKLAMPVRSNSMERRGAEMSLRCPLYRQDCLSAAAHCKCASMGALARENRVSIYIGDGRSDLCPARRVEIVFAKGALATALENEGRLFVPFNTLADVQRVLEREWVSNLNSEI